MHSVSILISVKSSRAVNPKPYSNFLLQSAIGESRKMLFRALRCVIGEHRKNLPENFSWLFTRVALRSCPKSKAIDDDVEFDSFYMHFMFHNFSLIFPIRYYAPHTTADGQWVYFCFFSPPSTFEFENGRCLKEFDSW